MQFINLQEQYKHLKTAIDANIHQVLEHGQFILGPEVIELEKKLADYVGVKHCVTVANGSDALMIALMALGIQPGDEVITSAFTFIASGEMISLLGAKPVFVDIDRDTYNIDTRQIEKAITAKTKALMPVSLYGQVADMEALSQIAEHYQLPVIEDAAQSFGASYRGKKSAGLSTIGCTSFFPTKPLGCYGDGGACFTNEDELALKMKQLRVHGQSKRYYHSLLGMNSRLDTLQAAILLAKLAVFDKELEQRKQLGERYNRLLKNQFKTMRVLPEHTCVYAQYTIEVPERSAIQAYLQERQIPTMIHYPLPLHLQPVFAEKHPHPLYFTQAEQASQAVLSLPMHPYLSEEEQDFICDNLFRALEFCQARAVG